jgi:hypothetical protein
MVVAALTIVVAVAIIVVVTIIVSTSMVVVPVTKISMLVVGMAGYVPGFVFLRSNEIHRPIAGVVLVAVPAPILCVPRRDV